MLIRQETIQHLRSGKPIRFELGTTSFSQGHAIMDDLEESVGLTLERRDVIDTCGSAIVCWVRGFPPSAAVTQYQGVGDGTPGGVAAD